MTGNSCCFFWVFLFFLPFSRVVFLCGKEKKRRGINRALSLYSSLFSSSLRQRSFFPEIFLSHLLLLPDMMMSSLAAKETSSPPPPALLLAMGERVVYPTQAEMEIWLMSSEQQNIITRLADPTKWLKMFMKICIPYMYLILTTLNYFYYELT